MINANDLPLMGFCNCVSLGLQLSHLEHRERRFWKSGLESIFTDVHNLCLTGICKVRRPRCMNEYVIIEHAIY